MYRQHPSRQLEAENVAEKMRYDKIIDLEHGKPVFSSSTVPDYDAVIIEMEHEGLHHPACLPSRRWTPACMVWCCPT